MNRPPMIAILLAMSLAACGQPVTTGQAANVAVAAATSEGKEGSGVGTITAIDAETGRITLAHGPVAELEWPAMTMSFAGNPAKEQGLAVGDKVAFKFVWDGKTAQLRSIEKR